MIHLAELWDAIAPKSSTPDDSVRRLAKGAFFAGIVGVTEALLTLPEEKRAAAIQEIYDEAVISLRAME